MAIPFNAVRAFAAAGRHLSLTLAARELHVTQGAVSQQIARLEAYLGCTLFVRNGRGLQLTPEGRGYHAAIATPIDQIATATELHRQRGGDRSLGISTLNSFAAQWLMPRLPEFQAQHRGIRLRIETSPEPIDLQTAGLDAAIRHGRGTWRGCTAEKLFGETCFPVATPGFASQLALERGPRALRGVPLMYDTDAEHDWYAWFRAAGFPDERITRGHSFSDSLVMIGALLAQGESVALVRSGLVERELADGRLVRLFDTAIPAWGAYYLVYPSTGSMRAPLRAFRDWLMARTDGLRERV
jgi:LysR family transcriptional regulator, glycine cleavage system transcriptional activator